MSYDNPIYQTYTLDSATLSAAADLLEVIGPKGKQGRLVAIGAVVTTDTTVAASLVLVGIAADKDKYGTLSVPIIAAGNGYNAMTDLTSDTILIAKDTPLIIGSDGGCTAGAATITVTVAWF